MSWFGWSFTSTTIKTSDHLGPNCRETLEAYRNIEFKVLKTLLDKTQRLILEPIEILNVSTVYGISPLEWDPFCITNKLSSWRKLRYTSTQIHSYVWETCMIIQKRMESGTNQFENFPQFNEYTALFGIDGKQFSSSGIFPRIHIVGDSRKIPKYLETIERETQQTNPN